MQMPSNSTDHIFLLFDHSCGILLPARDVYFPDTATQFTNAMLMGFEQAGITSEDFDTDKLVAPARHPYDIPVHLVQHPGPDMVVPAGQRSNIGSGQPVHA